MRSRRLRAALAAAMILLAGPTVALDLQGHRGARGLAPENTLAGFERALAEGVTTLELDTVMSADGSVVVHHDLRLNPDLTRDVQGRWLDGPGPALNSLTLADLQAYDVGRVRPGSATAQAHPDQQPADGQRIPTLAAVFERVRALGRHDVRFNIETKLSPREPTLSAEPGAFARALVAVIRAHGMEARVTVQSFDWRTLDAVRAQAPSIPTACLTVQSPRFDNVSDGQWTAGRRLADHGGSVPALVKAAGCRVWSPQHQGLDADALRKARDLGLTVAVWTVNEPAAIEAMLDLGVDAIISDRPDRVRAALAARPAPVR